MGATMLRACEFASSARARPTTVKIQASSILEPAGRMGFEEVLIHPNLYYRFVSEEVPLEKCRSDRTSIIILITIHYY